jgi:hypothetical protein
MQDSNPTFQFVNHTTIALALRAPGAPTRRAMASLSKAAPPPLDHASLRSVLLGARKAVGAAVELVHVPSSQAVSLREEVHLLTAACIAEYEVRPGCVDSESGLRGRLRAHPAWALFGVIGAVAESVENPAIAAAGIELLLSWHQQKPMAAAFCTGARIAVEEAELNDVPLEAALATREGETPDHWVKHCRARFAEFLSIFDGAPPGSTPPPTFEHRARTELSSKAAFASYRRRAGVLDDTCFSRRQIAEAVAYAGSGVFRTPAERRAAMWVIGCSGLFATSVQYIPLASARCDDWVMTYDVETGILRRDLQCLVPEAARPRPGIGAPASFVAMTPAPVDVREELQRCWGATADPRELGDIIPALRRINPKDLVYPDLADLAPSFARWARTLAPLGLQVGLDTLLTGLATGDIGVTARSKLHYCLVEGDEIWHSSASLYQAIGWEQPVPMPSDVLPFGAAVVPAAETLRRLDDAWCRWVAAVRPPKRLGAEAQLLEFHNRFVRALASRLAAWVSLRPAAELSLRASIDERWDLCVDLFEKSSAGRSGTLPAVICDEMRAALTNHREHCKAMFERLRTFGWSGPVMTWLSAVGCRRDAPLLCTIQGPNRLTPLSTDDLRKVLPGASDLAADWGRKFAENFLRLASAQSRDIDRHQRHEVLGQEQNTSVADSTETTWVRRIKPALNDMSKLLFSAPLDGLHKGARAR